jgi:hypothetical protein
VSFASEPGRDDSSLPPLNVVIPDDARELDREVLAYRREMRVKRRRQRLLRLIQPVNRPEFGGHAAIVPLIAICLALTLVGGALLSVATMGPAAAPTFTSSAPPAVKPSPVKPSAPAGSLTKLPAGNIKLDGQVRPARSLISSAIALVPQHCACGTALLRLANQAKAADVGLYFVASGAAISQLPMLTSRYGDDKAEAAVDADGVFGAAYHPVGLTVLLVFSDATAEVHRDLGVNFQFAATLSALTQAGSQAAA